MDQDLINKIESDVAPDVLAQLIDPLERLLSDSIDQNYSGERVLQLLRLERADYFYRGIQNIAPTLDPSSGAISWVAYGTDTGNVGNAEENTRAFDYNPRLTKSYGDKFVAVLGQRPFYNCTAEAGDPTNENDRRGARQVNLLIQKLQGQWKVRLLNHRLCYYLFKTGTTFGHLRPVTDERKFGFFEVPNIVQQDQEIHPGGYICPQCGTLTSGDPNIPATCQGCGTPLDAGAYQPPLTVPVPVQQGTTRHENTSVELVLLNGYTVTVPFNVVELEDSPWIRVQSEKDRGELLATHANARDIVGTGTGSILTGDASQATGATVRAAAQSQTGTVRSSNTNMWSYQHTWISPAELQLIEDADQRARAIQAFPKGLKITQIQGKTVAVKSQDFREYFSACSPAMADYLFTDGTCWGMLGLEDYFSNLLNIAGETLETGIPKYLLNTEYVDADAFNRNRWGPNQGIPALPKAGENLGNAFQTFPSSDFPNGLPAMFPVVKDVIENYLGLLPQVYGAMPGNLTLGQARMMLNQGLMQLGTVGELMTNFWEQTWNNAVRLYCEVAHVNPQFGGEAIDLDLIKNTTWVIKGDSTMPRSFAERKDALQEIITQNPDMAKALKVTDPINFPKLVDYLDLPDLDNPDVDMIEALKEIIDQLWQGQPSPQPDGSVAPSIPFDGLVFNAQIASGIAQASLVSALGQQRNATPGYANVRAFLDAAQQAANAQQQAQPEPPRLSFSMALDKMPPDQEMAVLQKYGFTVPPPQAPSMAAQSDIVKQQHGHELHKEKMAMSLPLQPPPGSAMDQPLGV